MVTLYAVGEQTDSIADPTRSFAPAADQYLDDLFAFCRANGLSGYLEKAVELAREAFAPIERLEADVRQDPSTDERWIVLRVVVRADRVDVAAARKAFTAAWVASVPVAQRFLVRLSPDIL